MTKLAHHEWEYDVAALPDRGFNPAGDDPAQDLVVGKVSREERVTDILNSYAREGWRLAALHPTEPGRGQLAYAVFERGVDPVSAAPSRGR